MVTFVLLDRGLGPDLPGAHVLVPSPLVSGGLVLAPDLPGDDIILAHEADLSLREEEGKINVPKARNSYSKKLSYKSTSIICYSLSYWLRKVLSFRHIMITLCSFLVIGHAQNLGHARDHGHGHAPSHDHVQSHQCSSQTEVLVEVQPHQVFSM